MAVPLPGGFRLGSLTVGSVVRAARAQLARVVASAEAKR